MSIYYKGDDEFMKDRYIYPAIFEYDKDGIAVEFPNLSGCVTCADNTDEALKNAKEALSVHLYGMEKDEDYIPDPTPITEIKAKDNQVIILIDVWMPVIRDAIENKAVKKTLTIPKWLDELAKDQNVNFSLLLQKSIKDHLGIEERNK